MSESIYAFVLEKLQATKYRWPAVSAGSGVPIRTLEKIARQETRNPKIETIEKLASYFREQDAAAETAPAA